MANYYKYFLFIGGSLLIGFIAWYFHNIISYILISAVLSLMGAPVVSFLCRIRIKSFSIPRWVSATIALVLMWTISIVFFKMFVPMIVLEAQKLSAINDPVFLEKLTAPLGQIDIFINKFTSSQGPAFSSMEMITQKIQTMMQINMATDLFTSFTSIAINLFIASFSITFITFFFLKDQGLFSESVLLFVAPKYESATIEFMESTKNLLMRYFVGIGLESLFVIGLTALGLYFVGLDLQTSMVIALFSGIINVIPYIGPLFAAIFAIILGLASKISILPYEQLSPLIVYILVVFLIVRIIDNFIFQPVIYSNSVKAHPLEIFIITLIGGQLAGIVGMLVAIPGYTVIRVFAKQFLNNFEIVKKLTEKI